MHPGTVCEIFLALFEHVLNQLNLPVSMYLEVCNHCPNLLVQKYWNQILVHWNSALESWTILVLWFLEKQETVDFATVKVITSPIAAVGSGNNDDKIANGIPDYK